ncbi:MAG TPA: hypothetical protein VK596_01920 [Edaphobacter sp.]|nr:hypothetical protein [Edaphobacter sp.]
MKTGTSLVTTLVAIASFPLLAQQSPPTTQPSSPATQQSAPATESASPSTSAASPAASTAPMSPISGDLVSTLDSKTTKAGDSVTVQIKSPTKTAEGTEIPKGSKLVGRVLGVKSSGAGENSQVVLQFDHLELKGGQNLPVHSQIQSISPEGSATASGAPTAPSPSPSPDASNSPSASGTAGAAQAQSSTGGASAAGPAAGTVVAKTGNIDIRTTSVPGVLLANNAPGQQDPRMAQASSILLGAKQDIQLNGGTHMVVGVSTAAGGGAQ